MSLLKDRSFLSAGFAHLGVDLLNSQKSVLLAFLSGPLGLTNSIIGIVSTLYALSASLSQPVFGWLADRFGSRWVVTAGVLWLGTFFGAAVLTPGYGSLLLLVVAALGSAAFHPAGMMEATIRGRAQASARETTATSLFFFFGQTGLSVGPMIGGPLLDRWGPPGLLLLLAIAFPAGVNASSGILPSSQADVQQPTSSKRSGRVSRAVLVAFIGLAALRGWIQFNFITFLPKYFRDLGFSPAGYGLMAGFFMAASAVGNITGGWLGDRVLRHRIVVITLALGSLPIMLFAVWGETPLAPLLVVLSGALTGASHSVIMVTAQRLMPRRMGAASGIVLGFTFASGSLGAVVSGIVIDLAGYPAFYLSTAVLCAVASGLGLSVRSVGQGVRPIEPLLPSEPTPNTPL